MRFFTRQWAAGELSDEAFEAAPGAYALYLASLELPADVALLSRVDLHDGRVLDVDVEAGSVAIRLRCGDLQRGYSDVRIGYGRVALDAELQALLIGAAKSREEVLYDELDCVDGVFQHRWLLASHAEVCISFGCVSLLVESVRGRGAGLTQEADGD
jgi:hypothetical protein